MSNITTCNVINYLCVSSACNVKELVDVGADSIAFLGAHVETPLQIESVIVNHGFDLLQDHVKPETDTNIRIVGGA